MEGPWFACPACGGKEFELAGFHPGTNGAALGGLAECQACRAQFRDGTWWAPSGTVSRTPLVMPDG